jgi:DNA-binding transcriptional regulator YiaG
MNGAQVKRIRKRLKLKQEGFAKLVGVHRVTVARWETDAMSVTVPMERFLRLLAKGGGR